MGDFSGGDEIDLPPGFRFHPTDEELITHYLSPKMVDTSFTALAIGEADFNKVEPWEFPWKAKMREKDQWYFFCVKDRKYSSGVRANRSTRSGYWKATGKDKEIYRGRDVVVGMKKTLVFYRGRAPTGEKTNWVMHEYRSPSSDQGYNFNSKPHNIGEWVICRVFNKAKKTNHISGLSHEATVSGINGENHKTDLLSTTPSVSASDLSVPNVGRLFSGTFMGDVNRVMAQDHDPMLNVAPISYHEMSERYYSDDPIEPMDLDCMWNNYTTESQDKDPFS